MTSGPAGGDSKHHEALLAEYAEVNANFRLLTDIRFKLLAFLPVAVAAALAAVNVAGGTGTGSEARALVFYLFGLVVTVALATYSARNDQIYVWMVERGEQIERDLGIADGAFGHRPNAWFEVSLIGHLRWPISHAKSIGLIYAAASALWLGGTLVTSARLAWGAAGVPAPVYASVVLFALVAAFGGAALARAQRSRRRLAIVTLGEEALDLVASIRSASRFEECEQAPGYAELVGICARLLGREGTGRTRAEEVKTRIEFYARLTSMERRAYGLEREGGREADLQYLALLVDLPPQMLQKSPSRRWIAGGR